MHGGLYSSSYVSVTDHATLRHLSYASSGHTGFAGTGVANAFTVTQTLPVQDSGGQWFNVKAYNAKGDNATDDTINIRNTITAAGIGGTIFFPIGTYLLSGGLELLSGQTIIGSGATLKRVPQVLTSTTTNITSGSPPPITLASVANLAVGMDLAFYGAGPVFSAKITNGGTGFTDGTYALTLTGGGGSGATGTYVVVNGRVQYATITAGGSGYTSPPVPTFPLGGGTGAVGYCTVTYVIDTQPHRILTLNTSTKAITVSNTFGTAFPSGCQVATSWRMITSDASCRVADLKFDGNRGNWTWSHWEVTAAVEMMLDNTIVERCQILNTPGEGIILFGNYNTVKDCFFSSLSGNAVHLSGSIHPVIDNCNAINTNLNEDVGHADGAFIWSNSITDAVVSNCYVNGARTGIGSIDSADNSDVTLVGNVIRNAYLAGIYISSSSASSSPKRIVGSANRIYNCGAGLIIQQAQTSPTDFPSDINLSETYIDTPTLQLNSPYLASGLNSVLISNSKRVKLIGLQINNSGNTVATQILINASQGVTISGGYVLGGLYGVYIQGATTSDVFVGSGFACIAQNQGGIRFQTAGMLNCEVNGAKVSNDATADATNYVGIFLNTKNLAVACTINLTQGKDCIQHSGNDSYSIANNVKGATNSIRTTGGSSGNVAMNNLTSPLPLNGGGSTNIVTHNIDTTNGTMGNSIQFTTSIDASTTTTMQAVGSQASINVSMLPKGSGSMLLSHLKGQNTSGTTTFTAGVAAGTGPTVSITGNDTSGSISVTIGTSPTTGLLGTITFSGAYPSAPTVTLTQTNANAGGAMASLWLVPATGTVQIQLGTALVAGQTYTWNYHVIG